MKQLTGQVKERVQIPTTANSIQAAENELISSSPEWQHDMDCVCFCCWRSGDGEAHEAMYGVTGAIERDIDELFEDSGSEKEQQPATTGISRSGRRMHQHR